MRDASTAYAPGDIELLMRVRSGDTDAASDLVERHRGAVACLPDRPDAEALTASARALVLRLRRGDEVELPFRAAWLAQHTRGDLPEEPEVESVVWTAYVSLPVAWRLAVWHREVEGQSAREIARFLGVTELETMRALASSYAAMKRYVAMAHSTSGDSAACQTWLQSYRVAAPAVLDRAHVRALREHGRRCDACLGLVRDLFTVDTSLRTALAEAVLGPVVAATYLAQRPRAPRLRRAAATRGRPDAAESRLRPVLAALPVAGVALAALVLVLGNLTNFGGPAHVLGATRSPSEVVPGVGLEPAATQVPVGPFGPTGPLGPVVPAVRGPGGPGPGGSPAGGGTTPDDAPPVVEPTPDPGPGPGPVDPPTPPPTTPPAARPPVAVTVSAEAITVVVDLVDPIDPIEATVPLPPLPVPVLPGSGTGGPLGSAHG